jgi:multiple sugar transport system ATP-binding protein
MQKTNNNKEKIKVRLENINKYYYGKKENVHAVKELSFYCRDKEFVAMLGPSGCGKSSTLRMIAGLEEVSSGSVYFGDREVTNLHPSKRNIGLAFENYALYPHLSVYENIVFPLRVKGVSNTEIKNNKRLWELIELFEIDKNMLDAYPKALSGGQAQLTSLVRCLIRDADVYLLDEPLSHMDEEMRVRMRTTLKIMHHKMKSTFIYVTHDQLEAFALADRIVIMNFGVLQQAGSPQDIYSNPANQFVASFIGEPPMNFLECYLSEKDDNLLIHIGEQKVHFPDEFKGKIQPEKEYILGIRPERVHVSENSNDFKESMKAQVEIFEYLGESNQITLKLGKERVITEIDSNLRYVKDSEIFVSFDIDHMHLFDKDSLECLDYKFR